MRIHALRGCDFCVAGIATWLVLYVFFALEVGSAAEVVTLKRLSMDVAPS